ncbi:HEPN domain-containing protein [Duganella sp. P38]|uniref:HEPN domain-containing protein n=1 Tax=Duganella sp. P38 TaxID=3423949 RepID=UPI003D7AF332
MASAAKVKFDVLLERSEALSKVAGTLKKKTEQPSKTVLLHAALASQVAAWEVYIKNLLAEYFLKTGKPTDASFSAIHSLLQARMKVAAKKLNTPNSEHCREFLYTFSGFDPWPSWAGAKFDKTIFGNSLHSRNRLDEIFLVRHSFAHGFTMPAHSWNTNAAGAPHLDCKNVSCCAKFFLICVFEQITHFRAT